MKKIGELSKGCKLCAEGKKSVLFITGKCPRNCIYCPLSEEKKNNDIVNINELKTKEIKKIINEIKLSGSEGVGITGGDPLAVLDRTEKFIKKSKKKFGKRFHIHLYTSLNLVNEKTIQRLQKAGLDELRVHPDIFDKRLWGKLKLIKNKFKEVGIEIPIIPHEEKKVYELIEYSKNLVNFFNLNQLEYATLHEKEYKKNKWKVEEDYSVIGSEKTALKILNKYKNSKLRIHYCSSKFKDSIQFTNRIKLRAKNVAEKFDKITEEGTLVHGIVKIEKNKKQIKKFLRKNKIKFKLKKDKSKILFDADFAERISKVFPNVSIIEEYPTVDRLIVEEEKFS